MKLELNLKLHEYDKPAFSTCGQPQTRAGKGKKCRTGSLGGWIDERGF